MVAKRSWALGFAIILSAAIFSAVCFAARGSKDYLDKASTFIKKGEYGRAIAELNRAIADQPDNAQYRFTRADVYASLNRPDLAIADYSNIIENNPNNGQAYYNRAALYYSLKEYDKCWDDVLKAQGLGYTFDQKFINELKNASGEDK